MPVLLLLLLLGSCNAHVLRTSRAPALVAACTRTQPPIAGANLEERSGQKQQQQNEKLIDDSKVEALFAWISRAFAGEERYNNLMLAFQAIFYGDPRLEPLVERAVELMPDENEAVGEAIPLRERERGSLGAMGAGQWTGQWRTRPHALLDVRQLESADAWARSLPRGARRTLQRAQRQNFTVVARPIVGGAPAPHSTLAHFRCVVEHEVRLLASSPDELLEALSQAIGRYIGCTSQAGEIREYRDEASGRVIAFAHEVRKGRVIRGQWFYSTDAAAERYVWFHSVHDLVRRATELDGVHTVDLGPSGTDSFSDLKERYGFKSVGDWHTVADYRGPFEYEGGTQGPSWAEVDPPDWLFEQGFLAGVRRGISQ
jgi:hypothetical protein